MPSSPIDDSGTPAKELLSRFLAVTHDDTAAAFEALCAAHPAQAEDLRREYALHMGATKTLSIFGRHRGDHTQATDAEGARVGDVIGDFRLEKRIARGGQGEVWEARQLSLGRRVALKLVLPDRINEKTLAFFAREARAGGRLSHPGIVAVFGYGKDDGRHWISQELVEGSWTLRDFVDDMRDRDELPPAYFRGVASFLAELAEALQAAHDAGVIHRDVKPQNVLITVDDHPKLTDFGLARITDEAGVSMTGDLAGTWLYMSPEQVTASRIELDYRTDIFSLGVVMYEMVVLQRPFDGDTTHQIAENIVLRDPPDLRRVRSRVPGDLAVICAKALEKLRDARFQSMAEFAADLRRHLASVPIHAQPPTLLYRGVKWVRRHPAKSVSAVAAAVAFVVISALGLQIAKQKSDIEDTNIALSGKTAEAQENERSAIFRAEIARSSLVRLIETAERDLKDIPLRQAREARSKLLLEARGDLAKLSSDSWFQQDQFSLTAEIRTLRNATQIALLEDDSDQAMLSIDAAVRLARRYVAESKEPTIAARTLADGLQLRAQVGRRFASTEDALRDIDECLMLVRSDPGSNDQTLWQVLREQGHAHMWAQRPDSAHASYEESAECARRILNAQSDPLFLAASLSDLGAVLERLGDNARGVEFIEESVELYRVAVSENRFSRRVLAGLAGALQALGDVHKQDIRKSRMALDDFRESADLRHRLTEMDSGDLRSMVQLARCLTSIGRLHRILGEREEAEIALSEASEICLEALECNGVDVLAFSVLCATCVEMAWVAKANGDVEAVELVISTLTTVAAQPHWTQEQSGGVTLARAKAIVTTSEVLHVLVGGDVPQSFLAALADLRGLAERSSDAQRSYVNALIAKASMHRQNAEPSPELTALRKVLAVVDTTEAPWARSPFKVAQLDLIRRRVENLSETSD